MTTLPSRHFPFRASLLCLLISLGTSSALGTVSTLKPARVLNGPLMPVQETVFVQNQLVVLQDQDVIVAPGVSTRLQGNFFRLVADPVHPRVVVVGERLSVLETEKGRLLYTLGHSVTSYRTAAFSPDGHTLAALVRPEGRELVLEVWDLETGTRTAALPIAPEEEEVLSLAFTPDGRSVLTVGKAVRSWSLEKVGQSSLLARSEDLPWTRAVVSPEAVWVVSIGGGLTYLPLEAGRSVPPALADLTRNPGVVSVWRDAKSGLLAFGEKGGRITVFDPLSQRVSHRIMSRGNARELSMNAAGSELLVCDGLCQHLSVSGKALPALLVRGSRVYEVFYDPQGNLYSSIYRVAVQRFGPSPGPAVQTWPSSGDAAASDGTRLALADRSGAIFLYLLKTGVLEQTLRVPSSHAAVDRMAWVGGTLYSASSASGELRRWTLPAGTSKALISKANWMSGNQNFAPVRGQVVVSRRDSLEGVSLPEGQRLWKITAPNPFFLMVSAGGTRLAYKGLGGGWTLLELPGGKVLPPLEGLAALGRDREPNFGTFSPDGERLAMGVDKQVWLWDTRNGRLLARSSDLASEPGVLAFSPDGHRLAVGVGTPTEGAITELSVP